MKEVVVWVAREKSGESGFASSVSIFTVLVVGVFSYFSCFT
jgi:hypothetical protein